MTDSEKSGSAISVQADDDEDFFKCYVCGVRSDLGCFYCERCKDCGGCCDNDYIDED